MEIAFRSYVNINRYQLAPGLLLAGALLLAGCRGEGAGSEETTRLPPATPAGDESQEAITITAVPEQTASAMASATPSAAGPAVATEPSAVDEPEDTTLTTYGYTYQQPDGNRFLAGRGRLPTAEMVDIPLLGEPQWVTAAPLPGGGAIWAVVLTDGRAQAFEMQAESVTEIAITPPTLANMPPLLQVVNGQAALVTPPVGGQGNTTPAVLPDLSRLAFSSLAGGLFISDGEGGEPAIVDVTALPDGRLLVDEAERLLFLSAPTTAYEHGVLGDAVEAGAVTLVESRPVPRVALTIPIDPPQVIEGVAPLWVDLTGDGRREIIVTLSDEENGAQIVVFDETGRQIAAGPAIGRGFRWRHQLAVAPFGPNGELELVAVLTPHIGGVVEFYRLEGDVLNIVAQQPGYTSHVIYTRNLDMAVAADFDGDGRIELLLPNQSLNELGAVRRTPTGAEVVWTLPAGARITTSLAAVQFAGGLAVGVGRTDGVLRVWR